MNPIYKKEILVTEVAKSVEGNNGTLLWRLSGLAQDIDLKSIDGHSPSAAKEYLLSLTNKPDEDKFVLTEDKLNEEYKLQARKITNPKFTVPSELGFNENIVLQIEAPEAIAAYQWECSAGQFDITESTRVTFTAPDESAGNQMVFITCKAAPRGSVYADSDPVTVPIFIHDIDSSKTDVSDVGLGSLTLTTQRPYGYIGDTITVVAEEAEGVNHVFSVTPAKYTNDLSVNGNEASIVVPSSLAANEDITIGCTFTNETERSLRSIVVSLLKPKIVKEDTGPTQAHGIEIPAKPELTTPDQELTTDMGTEKFIYVNRASNESLMTRTTHGDSRIESDKIVYVAPAANEQLSEDKLLVYKVGEANVIGVPLELTIPLKLPKPAAPTMTSPGAKSVASGGKLDIEMTVAEGCTLSAEVNEGSVTLQGTTIKLTAPTVNKTKTINITAKQSNRDKTSDPLTIPVTVNQ